MSHKGDCPVKKFIACVFVVVAASFVLAADVAPKTSRQHVVYVEVQKKVSRGAFFSNTETPASEPEKVTEEIEMWLEKNPTKEIVSFAPNARHTPGGDHQYYGVWIVYRDR